MHRCKHCTGSLLVDGDDLVCLLCGRPDCPPHALPWVPRYELVGRPRSADWQRRPNQRRDPVTGRLLRREEA